MSQSSSESLLEQVQKRVSALVAGNADIVSQLLSDNFIYTNSSGKVLNKEQYLYTCITSGMMKWHNQDYLDINIHIESNVGILTAEVHDAFTWEEELVKTSFRTTQIYMLDGGDWKYIAGHTSAPA